jgi:hypothetical protein
VVGGCLVLHAWYCMPAVIIRVMVAMSAFHPGNRVVAATLLLGGMAHPVDWMSDDEEGVVRDSKSIRDFTMQR